ncbi:S-adenosyl-L-methionine-dependent methyltransferase [Cucurbitaria berberidis CBS 394.84]|uniref:S-adenosyl-L-methionine-dependent methyltransferase n=1 Tax=Cucurbitaria berberidis CBS 394.84 TaxID=1168544 RepID=A0A9P4L8I2_9PLEO|nr:S-adenosyl-L-methionine-dependent methyltransferase [Cucurbitaria berberidis CBS 394.84]KAF1846065.1 S-adenosyl-L-methionine-dependent methyltransferase [Cucurbitaria berberidis CBS 394.84]
MTINGEHAVAQHLQLKNAVGPNVAYLCTAMEIGVIKAFIDWKVFDHIPDEGQISSSSLADMIGGEQELLDLGPDRGGFPDAHAQSLHPLHGSFPAYLALHGFSSPKHAQVTPFGMATEHPNENVYEIIAGDPKLSKEFDSFIGRASKVFPMNGVYDLSWMQKQAAATRDRPLFVDIGGSNGHALRDILKDHPWLSAERCAVFDRAPTIEHTRANLDDSITSIQLVAGSVLDVLPSPVQGALIYQLHRVLNDFPDDDVRRCWKSLRTAAAPDTRVNVVEELLQANRNVAQDISLMLVGGKRRNAQMHAALAGEAGFKLNRIFPDTYNDCSVLEFLLA